MIFQILVLLFCLLIAYVHYIQGFFSAALSAIFCVLAAVIAVGYHETVASYLMKFPDNANGLSLILVFVVAYVVPKLACDKLVPGNVRFPVAVDKAGAVLAGLVAGFFGTGVFALAAQSLPFDAAFGMYSRISSQDRSGLNVPGAGKFGAALDAVNYDELMGNGTITDPTQTAGLWLGQDAMLVSMASKLSTGTLAGNHALTDVHPDLLTEIFGQRLGAATGGKHSAISPNGANQVKFSDVYQLPANCPLLDGENLTLRDADHKIPEVIKGKLLVAVRLTISPSAANVNDVDGYLRMAVPNVRLVVNDGAGTAVDVFAVGTAINNRMLMLNRADDPLMIHMDSPKTVDFVFQVDPNMLDTDAAKNKKFRAGSFIEFRRYANYDLSGKIIAATPPEATSTNDGSSLGGILRQTNVLSKAAAAANAAAAG